MKPLAETKLGEIVSKVLPSLADDLSKIVPGGQTIKSIVDIVTNAPNVSVNDKLQVAAAAQELMSEFELELKDRADARNMQNTALGQEDKFSKRFVYILASVWSVFAILYIVFITFYPIPKSNERFADTILGFLLGTVVATILGYFFGSSKSSSNKDEMMKQIISQQQNTNQ